MVCTHDHWVVILDATGERRVVIGACCCIHDDVDDVKRSINLSPALLMKVIEYMAEHCPIQKVTWRFKSSEMPINMEFVNMAGVRSDYYLAPAVAPDDDDVAPDDVAPDDDDDDNHEADTSD